MAAGFHNYYGCSVVCPGAAHRMPAPKRKTNPKAARKAAAKKEEAFHRKGEELRGEYTTAVGGPSLCICGWRPSL
jgi:hypothetical protein